jgi:chromosome partitioning protein
MDDEAEIGFFLLEPRPRLQLLPDTIDIEADGLLKAYKVNRELLLRRKLRPVLRDFDIIIIDSPLAMRTAMLNGLTVADTVVIRVTAAVISPCSRSTNCYKSSW